MATVLPAVATTGMATGNPLLAARMQASLIVALLSIFGGIGGQEIGFCCNDLTVLYNDLEAADLFAQKTYTLCPNTALRLELFHFSVNAVTMVVKIL